MRLANKVNPKTIIFTDVQPHHQILDMCASPGSKSKHVLELMHQKSSNNQTPSGSVHRSVEKREIHCHTNFISSNQFREKFFV